MLTAATVWVGKYPLAKDEEQYKDQSAELVFITGRSVWPYRISEVVEAFWDQTYEGAVSTIPVPLIV